MRKLVVGAALVLAACGGGGELDVEVVNSPTTEATRCYLSAKAKAPVDCSTLDYLPEPCWDGGAGIFPCQEVGGGPGAFGDGGTGFGLD